MLSHYIAARRDARRDALLARIPHGATVLDVGGTPQYWQGAGRPDLRVTILNMEPMAGAIVGDARDLSRFGDQSFDVVFTHSVIGHVGSFTDQQRMASEVQRVGRIVILQTPNFWFPLDWHTRVPCFHWLPVRLQAWCFRHLRVGTYPKAPTEAIAWTRATRIRNMSRRELRALFPGADIQAERWGGLAKSLIVTHRS